MFVRLDKNDHWKKRRTVTGGTSGGRVKGKNTNRSANLILTLASFHVYFVKIKSETS